MTRKYIFGYGSLIHPQSIARTLDREISQDELIIKKLHGFVRSWQLVDHVVMKNNPDEQVEAVFLDITPMKNRWVNGVLFEVNDKELERFDQREKNYSRVNITDFMNNDYQDVLVYTYIGKNNYLISNFSNPNIMKKYMSTVENGLKFWNNDFVSDFKASTLKHSLHMKDGEYKFLDESQNKVTGRNSLF